MTLDFDGKHVLVTGGTRGIGRTIVEHFAAAGAHVAFTYRSSVEAAETLKSELEDAGASVLAFQADAASFEAAGEVVDAVVKEWGSLDVLVNNAGITRDGLLLRISEGDWDAVLETNLKSVFNFCKAAYRPMMRKRAGKIVNISSVVGVVGNPGQTNYAASKAGIIGFSKSLAKELGTRGICVNVVAPGYIETEMTADLSDAVAEAMLSVTPLRRFGTTDDVARAVLFLSSEAADYVTGHVLQVDGGLGM